MRALDEGGRGRVDVVRWTLAVLVALVTFGLGATLALARDIPGITGDEPHYLLIAQSIALDGDIDLTNDYASPERVGGAYPGFTEVDPSTHAGVYREGGPLVPIHAIGLPLVLSPAYLFGGGYVAARFIAIALTALTAAAMFLVVHRLVRRPWIAVVATLSVMLVVPSAAFSQQLYPEVPAAALLAVSLATLVGGPPTRGRLVVASVLGALVPWMHLRFATLVVALALALLVRALGLPRAGGVRAVGAAVREHWRRALLVMAPMVVSAAGILAYHQVLYGSMSPNAAYRPDVFPITLPFQPTFVWVYGVGSLLDEQRGILPYAPVLLVAIAAVVVAWRRWGWWVALAVAACTVHLVVSSGIAQGGGYCPPGRWLVVFVPLLAVPLAAALDRSKHAWWLLVPALGFSLAVTSQLVQHYEDLYPVAADERQVLPVASTAAEMWPDVMVRRSAGWDFEANRFEIGPGGTPLGDSDVETLPGVAGAVVSGREAPMVPSLYEVRYRVRLQGDPGQALGMAQVLVGSGVAAELPLTVPASGDSGWQDARVHVHAGAPTEARVVSFGTDGAMTLDRVSMVRLDPVPPSWWVQLNDIPRAALWAAIAVLLAVLLLAPRRRARGTAALQDDGDTPGAGPAPEASVAEPAPRAAVGDASAPSAVDVGAER